jgi:DNA-binding CsgD family transcriptional regulator/tetratricopeptide (TPR) repeat protein
MVAGRTGAESFVGRERELDALAQQLAGALVGGGGLVLLAGEPGIGKTRLAEHVAARARALGARVLWGRCYEGEGAPAYWPWVQALRAYARERDSETLAAELGAGAADIAQVVPELQAQCGPLPVLSTLEPDQARFRLFDAVAGFLSRAARSQPLVLVLDDLHWADTPSLLLLRFLAPDLHALPLLIAATYRDVEVRADHAFVETLADLARAQGVQQLALRGLDQSETAGMMAQIAGAPPPDAIVAAIHRGTEGNPFFIGEIVRLLAAEERLAVPVAEGARGFALPATVRESISRRLRRLSMACNQMLAAAAVQGREFDLAVLRRVGEPDGEPLLELVDEAEAARVIAAVLDAPGRYRFHHALIRETLYDGLGAARRVRLHRQVGVALEAAYGLDAEPYLAELAHHFVQAAPGGDVATAIDYARRAAERASRLLAYEEASRHYALALQALVLQDPVDEERRCTLLLALAEAQNRAGDILAAREALRDAAGSARRLGRPDLLARTALGFVVEVEGRDQDELVVGLLEEALAAVDAPGSEGVRVMLLARLATALKAPARQAALSAEAVAHARRAADPSALAEALAARHAALARPEDLEERLGVAAELLETAERIGDRELALRGHWLRLVDLLERGDMPAMDAELAACTRLAELLRQPLYLWLVATARSTRALLAGGLAEAERLANEALAIGRRMGREVAPRVHGTQMFLIRGAQGRLKDLEPLMGALVRQYPAVLSYRATLALLLIEQGRAAEAWSEWEAVAANDFADLSRDRLFVNGLVTMAQVAVSLRDARRAAILYDLLLPYAERAVVVGWAAGCNGAAARSLGLLAATMRRWEAAELHFDAALALNEQMGAWLWVARTQLAYAAMLTQRGWPGDRERGLEQVSRALVAAQEMGMDRIIAPAAALKGRLKADSPTPRPREAAAEQTRPEGAPQAAPLPDGLSPREVEVLRLLAAGRSNAEIADELTISVYTVVRHVFNIYGKIGVRRRSEATAYALRRGLVPPA